MSVRFPGTCECGQPVELYGGKWLKARDGTILPPVVTVVDVGTNKGHECWAWGYGSAEGVEPDA